MLSITTKATTLISEWERWRRKGRLDFLGTVFSLRTYQCKNSYRCEFTIFLTIDSIFLSVGFAGLTPKTSGTLNDPFVTEIVRVKSGTLLATNMPVPLNVPCAVLVLNVEIVAVAEVEKYMLVMVVVDGFIPGTYEIVTDFVPVVGGYTYVPAAMGEASVNCTMVMSTLVDELYLYP